ncbi:MAG: hypothetical protein ABEH90_03725 [Halolamina sp.]
MSERLIDRIWDAFHERLGDDLRGVDLYSGERLESRLRDDVRQLYSPAEDREAADDTIVKQLGLARTESAFKVGELRSLIRVFDEAYVLSWTHELEEKSGVMVSVERPGETVTLADLEWCLEYLDDEITDLTE